MNIDKKISLNLTIASKIGLHEALIFSYLSGKNHKKIKRNGNLWIVASVDEITEFFSCFGKSKCRSALNNLKRMGIVESSTIPPTRLIYYRIIGSPKNATFIKTKHRRLLRKFI